MKKAIENLQLQVQSGKVESSNTTILKLQVTDRFSEDFTSFHSSISSGNEYKNPSKFFATMQKKPKLWQRKFFYISERSNRMPDAVTYAMSIIDRKSTEYGVITGFYKRSFQTYIDDRVYTNPQSIYNASPDSIFTVLNTAPYASTAEVNALFYAKIGGVMYYAAKQTLRRFPELGVVFGYQDAAIGLTHQYAIPYLSIGPKELMIGGIVRPGSGRKKRRKVLSKKRRIAKSINQRFN